MCFPLAVCAGDYYVVQGGSGNGTEASPFGSIAAAVAAATEDGDVIHVAAGTYEETAETIITKAITLEGAGYETTSIRQMTDNLRVLQINNKNAIVRGFTVTEGKLGGQNHGSGVFIQRGTLEYCRVTGNTNGSTRNNTKGIGVCLNSADAKMSHCIVDHNYATLKGNESGGGVCAANGKIEYCLIADNTTIEGGGIRLEGRATFKNCTIAGNTAALLGGGIRVTGPGGKFENCLFQNNSADPDGCETAPDFSIYNNYAVTFLNCAFEKAEIEGSVTGDMVLKDPANGDYSLLPPSPAITLGIGYHEYDPDTVACGFMLSKAEGKIGDTFTLTAGSTGIDSPEYVWTIENTATREVVTPAPTGAAYIFTPAAAGKYSVTLTANGTHTYSRAECIKVGPEKVYVDPGNANQAFPYDTPATAATSLAVAYEAVADGGEILLAGKLITLPAQLEVYKDVYIHGAGTREATILKPAPGVTSRLIYLSSPNARIANLTVTGGKAGNGGGIYVFDGGGTVENCIISNNTSNAGSYGSGAGIYLSGGVCRDSLITGNYGGGGGASGVGAWVGGTAMMERCQIVRNNHTTQNAWGALHLRGAAVIDSCLIADNTMNANVATPGVYIAGGTTVVLRNCTITGNHTQSGTRTAGVHLENAPKAKVVNCILAGNTAPVGKADWDAVANLTEANLADIFQNCLFSTEALATGTAPQYGRADFTNPEGGDYTLKASSKAIDNGTQSFGTGAQDLAGNTRVMGNQVDIGCFEADPNVLAAAFSVDTPAGFSGTTFRFTDLSSGVTESPAYSWEIRGATVTKTSTEKNPVFSITEEGWYTVTLTVSCDGKSSTHTETDYILVASRDVYVSEGDDFARAWRNVIAGATLHVSGAVTMADTLTIDKAVTITGVSGSDADSLTCPGKTVVNMITEGVLMKDLKITGGTMGIYMLAGMVEDCEISGNYQWGAYVQGGGIYMNGGNAIIRRSKILNNRNGSGGGGNHSGGAGIFIEKGTVESCLIAKNFGGGDGDGIYISGPDVKIRNCTIADNYQWNNRIGGGIFFWNGALSEGHPEVVNCLVVSNMSAKTGGEVRNWRARTDGTEWQFNVENFKKSFTTCVFDQDNTETGWALPEGCDISFVDDPMFIDRVDYNHPKASPLVNRGTKQPWMLNAKDIDGNRRLSWGRPDIGCHEYQQFGMMFYLK